MRQQELFSMRWCGQALQILDQTKLPGEVVYVDLVNKEGVHEAIRNLRVRGAPAIAIAAAYGLFLGMTVKDRDSRASFFRKLDRLVTYFEGARPTAANLPLSLRMIVIRLKGDRSTSAGILKRRLLCEAIKLEADDRQRCLAIARNGESIMTEFCRVLTICNTGKMATAGLGTALGIVHYAHQQGKKPSVYACETRPLLQGARLTMLELANAGVDATLICDSAAGYLMQNKDVDLVLVGADCIARDGSTANKIGTYGLAVLAQAHKIPFYVAAPITTIDVNHATGASIIVEQRDPSEITTFRSVPACITGCKAWNPAFDITPPDLITAIITDQGIVRQPYVKSLISLLKV